MGNLLLCYDKLMKRTLVIGGTGMLAGLVHHLAVYNQVYVIARSERALKALAGSNHNVIPIVADYTHLEDLKQKLDGLTFDTIVAWIHSSPSSTETARTIARHCQANFFDITGSDGRNPSHTSHEREIKISKLSGIAYHRVVLGSKGNRWLTNAEISDGVLEATEKKFPVFIVGE